MKQSDQLIPQDQAKRLKELGVAQESLFYWVERTKLIRNRSDKRNSNGFWDWYYTNQWSAPELELFYQYRKEGCFATTSEMGGIKCVDRFINVYSAFTVAELGVMLGRHLELQGVVIYNGLFHFDGAGYHKTEAAARGAYLIHLLETEQLSVEVVNGRLGA